MIRTMGRERPSGTVTFVFTDIEGAARNQHTHNYFRAGEEEAGPAQVGASHLSN